jgi:pimeloyl-ACP methyl ester carboxylesterase
MLTSTHRTRDGTDIACEGSSDQPSDAFFVHATGFCKELWRPVVDALNAEPISWAAMDQRGHGGSAVTRPPYRWDLLAHDVIDVVGSRRPVGVGHSSGGAAIARAEAIRPGTFSALVLIEPIISPPPYARREIALATGAEKRRAVFADRRTARERFGRGPFGAWDPVVLDLYVEYGFVADDDGIRLACPPEVEADFYREGFNHDTWDRIGDIAVPVTIVAGARSDSHQQPYLSSLGRRFGSPEMIVVPDRGHLVPMEDPRSVADIVDRAVARQRG